MLTMFLRALLLYLMIILLMRLMGKRQIGQLQPYELVFTVLIADLAASPMGDVGVPLLYGVMPIAALMLCYAVISLLTLKSEKAHLLLTGRPSILVRSGVIAQDEMRRQGLSISELMEQMRLHGIENVHQVGCAVLETSGQISFFPTSQSRPVTPKDLQLRTGYESLPLHLIQDGKLQLESLTGANLTQKWLCRQLHRFNAAIEDVYFCALDTEGVLCVQKKQENRVRFAQALKPEEVNW